MDSTIDLEAPTLHSWLTELATMFQERDDFREEVARLQAQYAETCEAMYNRGLEIDSLRQAHGVLVTDAAALRQQLQVAREHHDADQTHIRELQLKLDSQNYLFGDVLAHPPVGPGRKNRAKLTPAQVGGIRSMVRNGSTRKAVAALYGVHPTTVSRIADGTYHREARQ